MSQLDVSHDSCVQVLAINGPFVLPEVKKMGYLPFSTQRRQVLQSKLIVEFGLEFVGALLKKNQYASLVTLSRNSAHDPQASCYPLFE